MKKLRLLLAATLAVTVLVSGSSLLLPSPKGADVRAYYSPIATSVVLADVMLALCSAGFFMLALKRFRPELKRAYRLLALSTVAVGVGLLVFPYIEYYGLWDNLALNISSYLQYLVGAPLMYAGIRLFYRKLNLHGITASVPAAIAAIVVCTVISAFLPYDHSWPFKVWQYDLFKVVEIIPLVLYTMAGLMVVAIRRRTGQEYRQSFNWLVIAMGFYVINTLGIALIEVIGYNNPYYDDRIYTAPAILGDACLVMAGYAFAVIGLPHGSRKRSQVTSVDIIVYVAGMASNQTLIDAYLDKLRRITASKAPGEPLSASEEGVLRETYLQIEDFLIARDPLRTFGRDDIRLQVALQFDLDDKSEGTFWPMLQAG